MPRDCLLGYRGVYAEPTKPEKVPIELPFHFLAKPHNKVYDVFRKRYEKERRDQMNHIPITTDREIART